MKKIIFVCTGNTCRSPMAEAIMGKKLSETNLQIEVASRGIYVTDSKVSPNAINVMKKIYNIDISNHVPTMLLEEDLISSYIVLCMEKKAADFLKNVSEINSNKIYSLKEYVGLIGDVLDPYGGTEDLYIDTAEELSKIIDLVILKEENKMIAIGSDHRGYELKEKIKAYYKDDIIDYGAFDNERNLSEPTVAIKLANDVASGKISKGILICGSGIGMCMAANKVKGIRCALCYNEETALSAKEHNNANIIALGADYIDFNEAIKMIDIWEKANFLEGIYRERIDIVSNFENERK